MTTAIPRLQVRELQSAHAGPISLDVTVGECVAIVGASGSGKSVLLRMIADLDPHGGEVCLDGHPCEKWPAPQWRRMVVYQAAEPAWWESTAGAHFTDAERQSVLQMLPPLGLRAELLGADIARLSTGERQRMALLRSLACNPKVLLLDEPASALDPASTIAVEALLRERMQAGLAIVLVTHSEEQSRRMGRRVLRMQNRKLTPQ